MWGTWHRWAPGWGSPRHRKGGFDVPKCEVKVQGGNIGTLCPPVPGGCPPWWEAHPQRGCPSQGMLVLGICPPLWDAHFREKKPSSGHVLHAEFPSRWEDCPKGMPVLVGCPFPREARPGAMPIPGRCPGQQNTRQPRSCTPALPQPFLRLRSDPTHGCGAVGGASGHLCPLWPLPR